MTAQNPQLREATTPMGNLDEDAATVGSGGYRLGREEPTASDLGLQAQQLQLQLAAAGVRPGLMSPVPRPPSFGLFTAKSSTPAWDVPGVRGVGPGALNARFGQQLPYEEGRHTAPPASGTRLAPGRYRLQEESGTTPGPRERGDGSLAGQHLQPTGASAASTDPDVRMIYDQQLRLQQLQHDEEMKTLLQRLRIAEAETLGRPPSIYPTDGNRSTGNGLAGSGDQGGYRHINESDRLGPLARSTQEIGKSEMGKEARRGIDAPHDYAADGGMRLFGPVTRGAGLPRPDRNNGGLSNGLQWSNPTGFLSNVTKLDTLTPAKFDAWLEQVTDCLMMAGEMPHDQQAAMLRLTLGPSVRELIMILSERDRNNPNTIIGFLRETARPNRDSERFQLLKKALTWRQGAADHSAYIVNYEKVLTRLSAVDLRLDEQISSFVLLQGLTSPNQRDIILSQSTGLRYDRIRAAILGLANSSRRTGQAFYGSDSEEAEDSSEDSEDGSGSDSSDDDEDLEDADLAKIKKIVTRRIRKGKRPFPKTGGKRFRRTDKGGKDGRFKKKKITDRTTCFNCGKTGHWAKDCPDQKKGQAHAADCEESASVMVAECAMRAKEDEINMIVDSGCSRNLMSKQDLPEHHQLRQLSRPITYRTANGEITCTEEATFNAKVKDTRGTLHPYEHRSCVIGHQCQPLLSLDIAEEFWSKDRDAFLVINDRVIPLKKTKRGMWNLPLYPE